MAASQVRRERDPVCLIHVCDKSESEINRFTDNSWSRVCEFAAKWLELDGQEQQVAIKHHDLFQKDLTDNDPTSGYHRMCYSRFTDKTKVDRAMKRIEKRKQDDADVDEEIGGNESPSTPSPKKRLRSHHASSALHKSASRSSNVLPNVCIICKKTDLREGPRTKRVRAKLIQAQTRDAGLLRQAANVKGDEIILRQIRDKDCVAIEVKYHGSCYRRYTKDLKCTSTKSSSQAEEREAYKKTFDQFCEEVIERRIIGNQEILRMSRLLSIFVSMANTHVGLDASSYRSSRLKQRLLQRFPTLLFHSPSSKTSSEFVSAQHLKAGSVAEQIPQSSTETETETSMSDNDLPTAASGDQASLHTLYTCALMIRKELGSCRGMPWPLTAKEFSMDQVKKLIPISMFNMLAWVTGASDEATLDNYVQVSDNYLSKLLSILQDIVYLESKGDKQTPI